MSDPLLLYSANTVLAFQISANYYQSEHFMWCSPYLGPEDLRTDLANQTNPPSSIPLQIYHNYDTACRSNDKHSPLITQNRLGLKNGAMVKLNAGIIDQRQHDAIVAMADEADVAEFRPFLYIVPFHKAKKFARQVPCTSTASVLSVEYILEKLPRRLFDAVRL